MELTYVSYTFADASTIIVLNLFIEIFKINSFCVYHNPFLNIKHEFTVLGETDNLLTIFYLYPGNFISGFRLARLLDSFILIKSPNAPY